jgi:hypothetical protein
MSCLYYHPLTCPNCTAVWRREICKFPPRKVSRRSPYDAGGYKDRKEGASSPMSLPGPTTYGASRGCPNHGRVWACGGPTSVLHRSSEPAKELIKSKAYSFPKDTVRYGISSLNLIQLVMCHVHHTLLQRSSKDKRSFMGNC